MYSQFLLLILFNVLPQKSIQQVSKLLLSIFLRQGQLLQSDPKDSACVNLWVRREEGGYQIGQSLGDFTLT
jgi:hypothetical protein